MAEATDASIAQLIEAIYIAYEMVGAFGIDVPLTGSGWARGFNTSLAVVAGVGKLLELTDDQLASAIAIAITPCIPIGIDHLVRQSHWKSMGAAHASTTATLAARLAKAGMTGPPHVFDGKKAIFEQVLRPFELIHLGKKIDGKTVPERVSHKFFPSFTESQGPLALMLEARKEVQPDEIESIHLSVTDAAWRQGGQVRDAENKRWDPPTKDVASHSFAYLVAKTLVDGPISVDSFTQEAISEPSLRPLMNKVSIDEDEEFSALRASQKEENAVVEITLTDGRVIRKTSLYPRGHALNPMTDEELSAKFDGIVSTVLSSDDHIELRERLWNLANEKSLGDIMSLLRRFALSED
jgi:2-methylcitrate dehydratase